MWRILQHTGGCGRWRTARHRGWKCVNKWMPGDKDWVCSWLPTKWWRVKSMSGTYIGGLNERTLHIYCDVLIDNALKIPAWNTLYSTHSALFCTSFSETSKWWQGKLHFPVGSATKNSIKLIIHANRMPKAHFGNKKLCAWYTESADQRVAVVLCVMENVVNTFF